ncbi:uncharacterized protein BXIN_0386 [Babesia sp. Xinjiang]|uniref:uncharacterized protein n=1 Tax=Babesia sp. Xinjiang TaxID=462227 RepID=UPI000A220800|nr:uncharacterized protein BXIN_0386 [Babesia sp. Xinjiang]ORM41071.1 hypothetical protein BXIN_0386 [Babesia sp. Xinjiang]
MGASASKRFDTNKEELVKNIDLACCRVKLLRKRLENELATTYQAINSNGDDAHIKAEQSIYQENTLHVLEHLTKDLNLLKARKHLIGREIDAQIKPCIATVFHCAERLDVPELRVIVTVLRQMYGKDLKPLPDSELINKLNPRPPTTPEIKRQIDKVNQLVRSSVSTRPAIEKITTSTNKRTELDDLLERIRRLRS